MVKSGNSQRFDDLYRQYYPRFVRFANGYVRDTPVAEDFVSEAFASYWVNRELPGPGSNPQAYILTIIKNKCLNHLQHLRVRQRVERELSAQGEWLLNMQISTLEACDPGLIFSKEVSQIVDETLSGLPDKTRRIFLMNRHDELSYKEIAGELRVSVKTVEFHISKALTRLRVSLKDFIGALLVLFFI